ncbi:hypothetical protein HK405_000305, partial [Cladochytrium tenue]
LACLSRSGCASEPKGGPADRECVLRTQNWIDRGACGLYGLPVAGALRCSRFGRVAVLHSDSVRSRRPILTKSELWSAATHAKCVAPQRGWYQSVARTELYKSI